MHSSILALALSLVALVQSPTEGGLREAQSLLSAGKTQEGIAALEALTEADPTQARAWYLLGMAQHAAGNFEPALKAHVRAADFPSQRANASYNAACACARLGATDEAFAWLERALAAGFSNVQQLGTDVDLSSIRADARFAALLPVGQPASFVEELRVLTTLVGEVAGDRFGWIARDAGDTDGDGAHDVWLSAPFKAIGGQLAGRVYLYSGRSGELRFQHDGKPGDQLGIGIECAGDVNGDGVPDQLAGASGAYGTGAAYVYSGVDGSLLLELRGEAAGDNFGSKVAGAGDQDGDGKDDVIIGAPNNDMQGAEAGSAYVYSGESGEQIIALDGERPGDNFGSAVDACSLGGRQLLVIGAPNAGPGQRGCVYVYQVVDGEPELAFRIESQPGDQNLGAMFVSVVGDVNGDGIPDVYGSDWNSNAGGVGACGRIYVHSGADGRRLHVLSGEAAGDGFGIGTAEAGDVDGDGCDDLLVGAWQNDAGASGAGRCYLYSGRSGSCLATYTCSTAGETFGYDTTGLGDVDGDGQLDFLITGADSFVNGASSGRVFVLSSGIAREK